jgi:hypothetical protein
VPIGATLAAAAVTAGASLIGANQAKDATKDATKATTDSNAAALALQKQQNDQQRADYAPWRVAGAGALQMLSRTMGVPVPAGTFASFGYNESPASGVDTTNTDDFGGGRPGTLSGGTTRPAGTPPAPQQLSAGKSAGQAYLDANPDVAAEYNRLLPTIDWNSPWAAQHGFVQGDPGAFGDWHYQNKGQAEGRTAGVAVAPTYAPTTATPTTVGTGGPTTANPATTPSGTPVGPNGVPLTPTNAGVIPTTSTNGSIPGQLINPDIPAGAVAGTNSRYGDFYASPDYAFRRDEGLRAVTGNYAARGLLDSGALGKGLIDYSQNAASQEFGSWYNRIAALAGVGQTAVNNSTAAGQAAANNQTGIIQNQGANLSSSIATQGGINAGLITGLGNTAAGIIQNLPQRSGLTVTPGAPYQTNVPGLIQAPQPSFGSSGGGGLYGPPI